METKQLTFALYFGNRGFFPEKLVSGAREELTAVLKKLGYNALLMDESVTKYGAIEGTEDGHKYAQFLKANEGKYDGVILCLPNFGDETGAIGARTTAFKTVRFDELTLQRYGITTEALDLSEVFLRIRDIKTSGDAYVAKAERLKNYTNWTGVPDEKFEMLTKLGVVVDDIMRDYQMDCMAFRCWIEIEKELGISPCVILSETNDRGIVAACELDVCNAVPMHALRLASQRPATCLDWNNNYGDDPDKCILFHCGPVPQGLMAAKGQIIDHPMFAKAMGAGCGWGCNVGRIAPNPITFASSKTADGKLYCYLGEGEFTQDKIAEDYFGCAGVAKIENLQNVLEHVGHEGYRHHVGVTAGHVAPAVREAFTKYLGYELHNFNQ
jgi:L-fucose isomerase-like protein